MLRQEAGKSRKQKRTIKQLHADLVALGYDGSYNRVAAFAWDWKAARQQQQQTCGRGVFVPLAFMAGEAFQFDCSEDWAIISGERTELRVAHFKLSYSPPLFSALIRSRPTRCWSTLIIPEVIGADRCGPNSRSDGRDPFGLGRQLSPCVAGCVDDGVVVVKDGV